MLLSNLTRSEQYFLAGDPLATSLVLGQLSNSAFPEIRARVAEHVNTPDVVLSRLIRDEDTEVRQSVVYNPRVNNRILFSLTEDESIDVRYALAENAMLPPVVLQVLSHDDNPYVALRAQQTLERALQFSFTPQAA